MAVYVDDMKAKFGRLIMCHMIADSEDELFAMVDVIGVQRKWYQYPGTHRAHFDIALSKRALAIQAGAKEITWKQTGIMCTRRRITGALGLPHEAVEWYRNHLNSTSQIKSNLTKAMLPGLQE